MKESIREFITGIPGFTFFNKLRLSLMKEPEHALKAMQVNQRILANQYRDFQSRGVVPYSDISDAGFRCYSEYEEDGILLYVLGMIGFKTRKVVEICCGNGRVCMATNLILNHGFEGFMFEGSAQRADQARAFFDLRQECHINKPVITNGWVTRENINDLLKTCGASGEVDVFSLDVDGNDYHLWEAITEINPRLLIMETHDMIPGDLSLTINYDPKFYCWDKELPEQNYRSASLLAMKKLCEAKGYRMIGAHRHGFNVFFLRNDLAQDIFPEVSIESVHDNTWTRKGQAELWPQVKDMDWLEV